VRPPLRVVRIYHSAVVDAFRDRDRGLRRLGVEETLIAPHRWNEGGRKVDLQTTDTDRAWTYRARTLGSHPYRFVYDPVVICRTLRAVDPDVLDIHEEPASLATFEALLVRALLRQESKVTLYSAQNITKRYPPPFRWIERWALGVAATVYCCNAEAATVLRSKGFTGKAPVIGLGVDTDRFTPASQRRSRHPFLIGYVGRLEEHKGVQVLLEAMVRLPSRTELLIAGSGPHEESLRTQIQRLGITERVRFVGFVAHDRLPDLYREFDLVVVPSLPTAGWREQFGRVAVEAMASGVPVVASADGSLPEVIGTGGVLVPPGDVTALADAVAAFVDDADRSSTYAVMARQRSLEFSWDRIARQHYDAYLEAVG
jgi:glycosyltransferase involved in cell wall biosynthesis